MDNVKLQRTTMPISSLVDSIDRQQLRLPEIQRDYIWKPAQSAGLLDSLYHEYPSGSILLWETDDDVMERRAKIEPSGAPPTGKAVQYLLDGQQRLTSLHQVFHSADSVKVVFNIETEKFQIQSAATAKDPRWVLVHSILNEADLFSFVDELRRLIVTVYPSVVANAGQVVEFRAERDSRVWLGTTPLQEFQRFLSDLDAGLTAGLPVDGDVVTVEGGQDIVEVPIGPFLVTGSLADWREMLEREVGQAVDSGVAGTASGPWVGDRIPVAVAEAE